MELVEEGDDSNPYIATRTAEKEKEKVALAVRERPRITT